MSSDWQEIKLGTIAPYWTKKIEADRLNEENYISADNMLADKGGITDSVYVPTSGKSTFFEAGDILVSNIRPYFKKIWYADTSGGCSNDVIVFRTKSELAVSKFVYYLLSKDDFFDFMMAGANGTKMPRGNKKSIPQYKVNLPPLKTQQKIASILSAYDDLIENNLKRIKLLEEKAQLTYEEWFVRMKFPGHETEVFDDETGLPEGWEKEKLKDLSKINSQSINKNFKDNILYIDIKGVSPNSIDSKTEYAIEEAPGRAKRIVKHGDIIWSCVRPNRKSHAIIWKPESNWIASTGFCVISPKDLPTSYLYQFLTTDSFVGYLVNLAGGAAYPAVKAEHFKEADIVVPQKDIVDKFDNQFANSIELTWNLKHQNQLLKEARDILLPRLMTGMIDPSTSSGQVVGKLDLEEIEGIVTGEKESEYKRNLNQI